MTRTFIITPSYLIKKKSTFAAGIATLSKLGFHIINPEFPKVVLTPREKAEQINAAFAGSEVDLILAQRGGYSAMKTLPFVDFDLIQQNPKVLAGFSDLTALINPIYERTGMVALHAPMVTTFHAPTEFTVRSFMNAMHGFPEANLFRGAAVKVLNAGTSTGILKGGNLVTLTALISTRWEVDAADSILFLEDVGEKPHQVDRYLTQWILAGKLRRVKGIILGDFGDIKSKQVYRMLASQMEMTIPVVHCPNIGHVPEMITLPVGAEVQLDTRKKQLLIKNMNFPGVKP